MIAVALLVELAWKSALVGGLALILLRLLVARSAAERSIVAALALGILLLLPLAFFVLPDLELGLPWLTQEALPADQAPMASVEAPPGVDWQQLAILAYALPAVFGLLAILLGLLRLRSIRVRAEALTDPHWLAALAAARSRLGLQREPKLLVSAALASPISWGVIRPVIVVDTAMAADPGAAAAVVTHELAHVARYDWLRLLAGRAATALFWFNPFVWVLASLSHRLCEQAADDAVLDAKVDEADYAGLLVRMVRHSASALPLAAHGVAPDRRAISERVAHALDHSKARGPVGAAWLAASLPVALSLGAGLAAIEPVPGEVAASQIPAAPAELASTMVLPRGVVPTVADAASPPPPASRPLDRAEMGKPARIVEAKAKVLDEDTRLHDLGLERTRLGAERTARGEYFSQRGEYYTERGKFYTQRGEYYTERGARLSRLGAERARRAGQAVFSTKGER